MTSAVQSFARGLWALREAEELTPRVAVSQGRLMYVAVAKDLEEVPGYDPEQDVRLDWARQVLAAARAGCKRPIGDSRDEGAVEMMLRTGDFKDMPAADAANH